MEVVYLNELDEYQLKDSCVALGFFDGIHLGHQGLINEVINVANQKKLKRALLTFDVHPKSFLSNKPFKYLMSLDDKINYLKQLDFDYLFVLKFSNDLAKIEPEQFIKEYIIKPNIKHVVCGFDFHFGSLGRGNSKYLINHANNNYEVSVINKLEYQSHKISSSYLRQTLKDGKVELASILLGRNYQVSGKIINGRKNGRKIGFPTINVAANKYVIPKNGVYSVKVYLEGQTYQGMANIGYNPTFSALKEPSLEVNIFDFNQDVYGKTATVEFIKHIRDEQKFPTIDDLIEQLNQDKITIINLK